MDPLIRIFLLALCYTQAFAIPSPQNAVVPEAAQADVSSPDASNIDHVTELLMKRASKEGASPSMKTLFLQTFQDKTPQEVACARKWYSHKSSLYDGVASTEYSPDTTVLDGQKCIPEDYKKVSCPVMRALIGSGYFYINPTLSGTHIDRATMLQVLRSDLGLQDGAHGTRATDFEGVTDWPLKIFKGAMETKCALSGPNTNNHVGAYGRDQCDMTAIHKFFDHGASSGILGSGLASRDGQLEFNQARFDKLISFARGNSQYSKAEWGRAINYFANNGANGNTDDAAWTGNLATYSWGVLTAEYMNTFAVLKKRMGGVTTAAVTSIWKDGMMPVGFFPNSVHNGFKRIDQPYLYKITADAGINIPTEVMCKMAKCDNSNTDSELHSGCDGSGVGSMIKAVFCGNDYENCGTAAPDFRTC